MPKSAQVIEAKGKFLIPGLWDMHVHIFGGGRFPIVSPLLIANGITGVREMGTCVPLPSINIIRTQIAEGKLLGPCIVAAGPIVDAQFLRNRSPPDPSRTKCPSEACSKP